MFSTYWLISYGDLTASKILHLVCLTRLHKATGFLTILFLSLCRSLLLYSTSTFPYYLPGCQYTAPEVALVFLIILFRIIHKTGLYLILIKLSNISNLASSLLNPLYILINLASYMFQTVSQNTFKYLPSFLTADRIKDTLCPWVFKYVLCFFFLKIRSIFLLFAS